MSRSAGGSIPFAWLALAFAAAALALYAPGFGGPFISDDVLYLEHNPNLALPLFRALPRVLLEPYFANWSPLHHLLLLMEWHLFGASPLPYRVVNALLHAGVALAFVAAAVRAGVSRRASVLAGAVLLAHPVASEAVAWINQSKTLLCVGLSLLALERWLAHLASPRTPRLVAALLAGVAALLSKPAAIPLPLILFAAVFTHGAVRVSGGEGRAEARGFDARRAVLDLMPLAIAAGVTFILNLGAQTREGGAAPWFGGSPAATAAILPWVFLRYARLAAAPFDVVHGVHPEPIHGVLDPRLWLPLLAIAILGFGVWRACRRRRARWLGPVWFVLMLLPVLQIVPMIVVYADRYLYAALPGALLFAADVGDGWARRGGRSAARALGSLAIAVMLAFALGTIARARVWGDPETLYREATLAFPAGRDGWTGLGATLHQREDFAGAAQAYLRSLAVFPDDGHVRYLLARVRLAQHREGLALFDLEESLRLSPGHPDVSWSRAQRERLRADGIRPAPDRGEVEAPATEPVRAP